MNEHIKRDLIKQGMARYIKKPAPPKINVVDGALILFIVLGALIAIINDLYKMGR